MASKTIMTIDDLTTKEAQGETMSEERTLSERPTVVPGQVWRYGERTRWRIVSILDGQVSAECISQMPSQTLPIRLLVDAEERALPECIKDGWQLEGAKTYKKVVIHAPGLDLQVTAKDLVMGDDVKIDRSAPAFHNPTMRASFRTKAGPCDVEIPYTLEDGEVVASVDDDGKVVKGNGIGMRRKPIGTAVGTGAMVAIDAAGRLVPAGRRPTEPEMRKLMERAILGSSLSEGDAFSFTLHDMRIANAHPLTGAILQALDRALLAGPAPRPGQRRSSAGIEFEIIDYDVSLPEPWLIRDQERALRRVSREMVDGSAFVSGPTQPETKREELERVARLEMANVPDGWTKGQWESAVLSAVEHETRTGGRGVPYRAHMLFLRRNPQPLGLSRGRTGSLRPTHGTGGRR